MSGEYRVKVTVRNNLLLSAIESAGYASQAEFARACEISVTAINSLVAMRVTPINHFSGTFTPLANTIMEVLGACPTDLWTDKQLTFKLRTNTGERIVSEVAVQHILESNISQMTLSDPQDQACENEAVNIVDAALNTLSIREKKVLEMRFKDDCTFLEVGEELGFSVERGRQIEAKALRKLRNPERAGVLRELLQAE